MQNINLSTGTKSCLLNGKGTHVEIMLIKFQALKAKTYIGKVILIQIKMVI